MIYCFHLDYFLMDDILPHYISSLFQMRRLYGESDRWTHTSFKSIPEYFSLFCSPHLARLVLAFVSIVIKLLPESGVLVYSAGGFARTACRI